MQIGLIFILHVELYLFEEKRPIVLEKTTKKLVDDAGRTSGSRDTLQRKVEDDKWFEAKLHM